jgi:hypothetical protein
MPDNDAPDMFDYAYFEVYIFHNEPPSTPFWPYKFTVGFQ